MIIGSVVQMSVAQMFGDAHVFHSQKSLDADLLETRLVGHFHYVLLCFLSTAEGKATIFLRRKINIVQNRSRWRGIISTHQTVFAAREKQNAAVEKLPSSDTETKRNRNERRSRRNCSPDWKQIRCKESK